MRRLGFPLAIGLLLLVISLPGSPADGREFPGLTGALPLGPSLASAAGADSPTADTCAGQVSSSTWITGSVDVSKTFLDMRDNSLALDAAGHPHLAYGGDHLYYAYYDGENWQVQTVDAGLQVGVHASLQLDANGRPHIAYYDRANDDLKYASYNGTAWHIETVDADDGMS